jgi:hypothetical protein
MHAIKWWKSSTRMFFDNGADGAGGDSGSGAGGSSGSASSVSPSPTPGGGDAGGGSTPAAPDGGGAASPAPSSSPDTPAAPAEMDWSQLGSVDDLDHIEIPAEPPPVVAAPKPPVAPPVAAAPAPTPQTPPQQEVPPVAPAAQAPTQPAPAGEAQAVRLSPSDPLGIATALEQNRDASIAHLAQSRFALSQEDIAELEDNAATFVPKMMARVHHEAQVSMMKFLAQAVPGMMKQFNTVTTANNAAEDQFFTAHKQLGLDKGNAAHRKAAFRIASIYRQANPDMPMEQLIADVGPMVAMSLKLPTVPGQVPGAPATQQPAPGTQRPTGFRPAVNGGGGAPPVAEPENEWAGMGREFD